MGVKSPQANPSPPPELHSVARRATTREFYKIGSNLIMKRPIDVECCPGDYQPVYATVGLHKFALMLTTCPMNTLNDQGLLVQGSHDQGNRQDFFQVIS